MAEILESNRTRAEFEQKHPDFQALLGAICFVINELDGGADLTPLIDAGNAIVNGTLEDVVENAGRCRSLFDVHRTSISIVLVQLFDELRGRGD